MRFYELSRKLLSSFPPGYDRCLISLEEAINEIARDTFSTSSLVGISPMLFNVFIVYAKSAWVYVIILVLPVFEILYEVAFESLHRYNDFVARKLGRGTNRRLEHYKPARLNFPAEISCINTGRVIWFATSAI